jgi:hypothetical protein
MDALHTARHPVSVFHSAGKWLIDITAIRDSLGSGLLQVVDNCALEAQDPNQSARETGTRKSGLEFFDGLSPLSIFSSLRILFLPGPQRRMTDSSNNGSHLERGGSSWRNSGRRAMPTSSKIDGIMW